MGNWTITVAQLPISNTGQFHNMILIRDDTGKISREIDGGPVDKDGELIAFGSNNPFQALTAYTSGTYPVGGKIYDRPTLYQPNLPESQPLFSGTQAQVLKRLNAAREAIESFDPGNRYTLTSGPVTDYTTGQRTPGFNSNSVCSTLLRVMGIDPKSALIPSAATPGSDTELLEAPHILEIIQRHNANTPEGDRIPYPPVRLNQRGDNSDAADYPTRLSFAGGDGTRAADMSNWSSLTNALDASRISAAAAKRGDQQNIRILSRVVAPRESLSPGPIAFDDRLENDRSSAPAGAMPAPYQPPLARPYSSSIQTDPRDIRILSRVPPSDGANAASSPISVPNQPTPQPRPAMRPLPPSVFGLPEPSTSSGDNMDDWFARWIKPLMQQ